MSNLLELKPNRLLLDSYFDGYRLSLREISMKKRCFETTVDRILLSSNQYSLLHAKLFGLHNHLIGDEFDENGSVYFVDQDWNINKIYSDMFSDELSEPIRVWQIPKARERRSGDYNVSMKFVSTDLAVVGDGTGFIYILQTGSRDNDDIFTSSFSEEIAGPNEPFIIVDATYKQNNTEPELHVLLLSIKHENPSEHYISLLHWVSLQFKNSVWAQTALKQLKTKGVIQYAAIEKHCEAVYIVSDSECTMVLNSDNPVLNDKDVNKEEMNSSYEWSQTIEDLSIFINLPENISKNAIHVVSDSVTITIKCDETKIMSGSLYQRIDSEMTTWTLEQNKLEISLSKTETGLMWPHLIAGDNSGKQILNSCLVEEVHGKLGHLTSEREEIPQTGTTFSSQKVEECDFESDKNTVFMRLSGITNKTTHKINLGSHQVLMYAQLKKDFPPAVGIRYDVDLCLWQPDGSKDDFSLTHEGTLLALGYIQASKQNKKFLVCPPNMEYSVVCESSGHVFIYRQKRPISTSELRHRGSSRRIQHIADQHVLNVTNDEILGVYSFNDKLFLLSEKYIMVLIF